MLNITGGGKERFMSEHDIVYMQPDHVFEINPPAEEIKKVMNKLF